MFWIRFLRLLASLAAEGLYNLTALVGFLLFRRAAVWRRRVASLMAGRGTAVLLLAGISSLSAVGCNSTFPGSSFGRQIENTAWTLETLADQSGEFDGLVGDLQILFDPEFDQMPQTLNMLGW